MVQDDEIYHYHLDHLGTPRELTNTEGKIVWKAHYKTYGNVALKDVEDVENNIRFQGQYFDEETGLHYNRHRYYDPSVGQFTTQDPIGLLGGVNNYQYAPNPVGWVDPLGLTCKESSNNPSPQGDNNKTSLTPRQLLALSPTLANNMKLMKDQGWEIDYKGAPGGGSYADKGASKIVIDVNTVHNPLELVQTMAHESGHALYTPDAYVPYSNSGLTRQQYIDANVMTDLKDEGEATIMNVIVRQEILNNGGPDIGVAGSQSKAYVEAYNEHYIKGGDRDKAREEIGKIFANNERPSTAPDKTYKEYYAQSFENHYDSDGENP